jgi:hypothetical protein
VNSPKSLPSEPPPTRVRSEPRWITTAGEAVGLIAGAVALVYLLGGLVYALRLAFDHFSLEAIVAVIGQLPRESVITAGFVECLAPAVLVGVTAALFYGARDGPKPRSETDDRLNKGPNWLLKLLGLLLLSLILVAPALVLALVTRGPSWEFWTSIFGIAVTYSLVLPGWWALRKLAKKQAWWYRLGQALAAGAIWSGMALVPSIMFGAAVPFESARVCVRDTSTPQLGRLIADTKERVLLSTGARNTRAVLSTPATRVRRVEYGHVGSAAQCPAADPTG